MQVYCRHPEDESLFAVISTQLCVVTCMNCGSNALFAENWGQTHLHTHHHLLLLHLDCPGSPPSHIQFCFLMAAVKAKRHNNDE